MGLRSWLCGSDPKLWSVGDHRVREASRVKQGEKKVTKFDGDPTRGGRPYTETEPRYGPGYRCVDCHKSFPNREAFKDAECYEVIES